MWKKGPRPGQKSERGITYLRKSSSDIKQLFLHVLNSQIVVLDIIIAGISPLLVNDIFNFVAMSFVGTVFGATINSGPQLVLVVSINSQLRVDVGFVLHVKLNGN